jgi:hypothetical protein
MPREYPTSPGRIVPKEDGGLNRSSQHPYRYEVLWMWSKKELIEKQARDQATELAQHR